MPHPSILVLLLLVLQAGVVTGQVGPPIQAEGQSTSRSPVLVELFTSEGCSSCPPADALLARLDREQPIGSADIIVLEEHVDYWDQGGWHDRFASHQITERQTVYGFQLNVKSIYTPEMVVDGKVEFVGNDAVKALRSISDASLATKLGLTVSRPMVAGQRISSSVSVSGALPADTKGDIYAALVDASDTTNVRDGENSGRQLQHVAVVRCIQHVGSIKQLASGPVTFKLPQPEESHAGPMRLVVFAQRSGQRAVLGAAEIPITP